MIACKNTTYITGAAGYHLQMGLLSVKVRGFRDDTSNSSRSFIGRLDSEMFVILILSIAIAGLVLWPVAKFVGAYYGSVEKRAEHFLQRR